MTIFFTSDTHFGHSNVIKYCDRPFSDSQEMDEAIISNWNSVVKQGDTVYHLGDFGFTDADRLGKIIDRLNGQKYLIYGNHDKTIKKNADLRSKFVKCCDYLELYVQDSLHENGKQFIVLCHYAMLVWNKSHFNSWMLHGHSHGSLKYPYQCKIIDVGVDPNQFTPLSYDDIKKKMKNLTKAEIDHH